MYVYIYLYRYRYRYIHWYVRLWNKWEGPEQWPHNKWERTEQGGSSDCFSRIPDLVADSYLPQLGASAHKKNADMDGPRYSPDDPYYRPGPVHTCLYVRVLELQLTYFLVFFNLRGQRLVSWPRGVIAKGIPGVCQRCGSYPGRRVIPAFLGYLQSVFHKNSTLWWHKEKLRLNWTASELMTLRINGNDLKSQWIVCTIVIFLAQNQGHVFEVTPPPLAQGDQNAVTVSGRGGRGESGYILYLIIRLRGVNGRPQAQGGVWVGPGLTRTLGTFG